MTILVSVNRHVVLENETKPDSDRKPPLRCCRGHDADPFYHRTIEGNGRYRIVYDPEHPLPGGTVVWMELEENGSLKGS